jgi:hypothetical protein
MGKTAACPGSTAPNPSGRDGGWAEAQGRKMARHLAPGDFGFPFRLRRNGNTLPVPFRRQVAPWLLAASQLGFGLAGCRRGRLGRQVVDHPHRRA